MVHVTVRALSSFLLHKVYRDSEPQCVVGKNMGRFLSSFYDLRTQCLYLCVGSTAPSLGILLFAINLSAYAWFSASAGLLDVWFFLICLYCPSDSAESDPWQPHLLFSSACSVQFHYKYNQLFWTIINNTWKRSILFPQPNPTSKYKRFTMDWNEKES